MATSIPICSIEINSHGVIATTGFVRVRKLRQPFSNQYTSPDASIRISYRLVIQARLVAPFRTKCSSPHGLGPEIAVDVGLFERFSARDNPTSCTVWRNRRYLPQKHCLRMDAIWGIAQNWKMYPQISHHTDSSAIKISIWYQHYEQRYELKNQTFCTNTFCKTCHVAQVCCLSIKLSNRKRLHSIVFHGQLHWREVLNGRYTPQSHYDEFDFCYFETYTRSHASFYA